MSYVHSKKRKKMKTPSPREGSAASFSSVSGSALRGALISLLCLIFLTLLSSVFCLYYKDPASITLPIGIALLYISSLTGGFFSARAFNSDKSSAIFSGFLCGFFIFVTIGFLSVIMPLFGISKGSIKIPFALLLRSGCIVSALFGAYLVSKKKKRKLRRKK